MNRYGHMLPGAEADAADRLGDMFSLNRPKVDSEENILRRTGTDCQNRAQRVAQQLGRENRQSSAAACEGQGAHAGRSDDPTQASKHRGAKPALRRSTQGECDDKRERRAWDSNPQLLAGHLNSNRRLAIHNWRIC